MSRAQDETPEIEFAPTFPSSDRTHCGYCNKDLDPYMNFCGHCGARVEVV
jgi:predicted amidophosphoribosyltransferase